MKNKIYNMTKIIIYLSATLVSTISIFIILFIIKESSKAIFKLNIGLLSPYKKWLPIASTQEFGLLPAIAGTLYVSILSIAIALILGLISSYFVSYYVNPKMRDLALSFIDIVAGIPSVIFGFIGLSTVVKILSSNSSLTAGQCIFSACVVLSIMLIPFIVSTCYESIEEAKKKIEPSALSLGISREFIATKFILPEILPSIVSGITMGFGRALGETMAVMMVIGNSPIFPKLFGRGQTIASLTALEMGSVEYKSIHQSVLYTANLILLIILFAVVISGHFIIRRLNRNE